MLHLLRFRHVANLLLEFLNVTLEPSLLRFVVSNGSIPTLKGALVIVLCN
jgi:hypothetical protein